MEEIYVYYHGGGTGQNQIILDDSFGGNGHFLLEHFINMHCEAGLGLGIFHGIGFIGLVDG